MGPFARVISSAAIAGLTLGSVGTVGLFLSATPVVAAKGGNSGGGSRGKSGDKSHGQNGKGKALGRTKNLATPGICSGGFDSATGIDVYNFAVSAVASAEDALQRAAARLDDSQIPSEQATPADAQALIASVSAQPRTAKTRGALRILERQFDYLQAREDLSDKQQAQAQARQFASKGIAMSVAAKATLEEGC